MALCPTNHTLTQGSSLHSPTMGYQKQNPDGVRLSANILCAALPFEMAIKSGRRRGSSSSQILQTSSACVPPLLGEGLGVRL